MESKEYWENRAMKREAETFAEGAKLSAWLFKEYQRAARDIRKQVNDFYARYARENKLSYDEAVRILNKAERQEWKASLGRWVKWINEEQDEAVKAILKAQLDALSYNSQITRLEALYGQIQMILNELFALGVVQMREAFGDMFTEGYYKKVYDIQQRVGFINEFAKINADMIKNVVSYPWSGADFSKRLWRNMEAMYFRSREIITQGLIQGKSTAAMSKELADRMGQSYKVAERLIRTETTHFHNEATKTAYNAAGVEQYEFMATLDNRTSDVCAGLDGKHFKVSEAKAGTNYPPLHPNCRSTTVEYDPHEALDWYNSGQPMPDNMTYEEWRNQHADADDQEETKSLIEENEPKTLQSPQEIEYNDNDNEFVEYKKNVPNATKTDFAHYKAIKETGVKGVPIVPAPEIDLSDFAFDEEHINDRNHGVTREEAEGFVTNARFALSKWGGKFLNYYSDGGAAFVNLEQKQIRTAFKNDEYDDKVIKMLEVFKGG